MSVLFGNYGSSSRRGAFYRRIGSVGRESFSQGNRAKATVLNLNNKGETKMSTNKERDKEHGKGNLAMKTPSVVSEQEWRTAHQQMLVKEKAFTRSRDALAA